MFFWILFPKIKCREELLLNLKAWSESSFFLFPFFLGGWDGWQDIPSSIKWIIIFLFIGFATIDNPYLCSVQFSHSVVSDSLQPHGLQHTGFPVLQHLPEFAQTHAHRVSDAIQPSHPLSSPSPPALNLSQHQGLFQWVGSSHQMARVLELQLQHQFSQWIFLYSRVGFP